MIRDNLLAFLAGAAVALVLLSSVFIRVMPCHNRAPLPRPSLLEPEYSMQPLVPPDIDPAGDTAVPMAADGACIGAIKARKGEAVCSEGLP